MCPPCAVFNPIWHSRLISSLKTPHISDAKKKKKKEKKVPGADLAYTKRAQGRFSFWTLLARYMGLLKPRDVILNWTDKPSSPVLCNGVWTQWALDTLGCGHGGPLTRGAVATVGLGHSGPWTHQAIDRVGLGHIRPWTQRPIDTSCHGHSRPWTQWALDTTGNRHSGPWTQQEIDTVGLGHIGLWTR